MRRIRDRLRRAYQRRLTRDHWHHAISLLNVANAIRSPAELIASHSGLRSYQRQLDRIAKDAPIHDGKRVPKAIHFVFGMKGVEELPYYAYIAIASAKAHNRGWTVYFHYHHEPTGPHWAAIKNEVVCVRVPQFQFYRFAKYHHYAHKADVVRMLALWHIGGVYLDIDTICCRPFEPLRSHAFVMGVQATIPGSVGGLCNAVMISQPKAQFLRHWLERYSSFRSAGRDALWDFHSVRLPVRLATKNPELITVLPFNAFFYPLWHDLERVLLMENGSRYAHYLQDAYVFHLWNNITGRALEKINWAYVQRSKSIYAQLARTALELDDETASGIDRRGKPQFRALPARDAAERSGATVQAL